MLGLISKVLGAVVKPLSSMYTKNQDRKQAKETGRAKLSQAKLSNETQITLSDAEWEAINAANQDSSWKDEYVTIIITLPVVGILAGAVWLAYAGDARLLTGTVEGIRALNEAGVDMGEMMTAVVFAAVGLKLWRAK